VLEPNQGKPQIDKRFCTPGLIAAHPPRTLPEISAATGRQARTAGNFFVAQEIVTSDMQRC